MKHEKIAGLNAKIKGFIEELAEETDAVRQSKAFKDYLDCMARFWRYSLHNQILIHVQCPQASRVAGFRTWNQLGRRIKAGSKAIGILAPSMRKVQKEKTMHDGSVQIEEEKMLAGFVPVNVFDVSQTEGKPLPEINVGLEGDDGQATLDELLAFCKTQNIAVETEDLGVNGLYGYSKGGKIVLDAKQSVNSMVNTLAHEIAHELLHQKPETKHRFTEQERELQAESVAYVVCKAAGLEPKSASYLAVYSADKNRVLSCLEAISEISKQMVNILNS